MIFYLFKLLFCFFTYLGDVNV